MEARNEIAVELRALSELVDNIGRINPYAVPDGYFDRFPAGVLSRIAAGSATFSVPEGYFDGLASRVLSRLKAAADEKQLSLSAGEELAALSAVVAGIGRETPYHAPEGYFKELSPLLTVIRDTQAYRVPEEYFEEISPILSVSGKRSAYRVPKGYFEKLPHAIIARVGRAIPIGRGENARTHQKVWKGNWWKYSSVAAVAACLLLIFGWPKPDRPSGVPKTASPDVVMQGLQKVSDQEIEAYLDEQHSFVADPAANSTAGLDMNEGEVKSLLSEASDSDLQQYMEEHGNGKDLATN